MTASAEEVERDGLQEIEVLRRALCWHGDPQRMATTREDWQQTVDRAVCWVKAHPEEGYASFSSFTTDACQCRTLSGRSSIRGSDASSCPLHGDALGPTQPASEQAVVKDCLTAEQVRGGWQPIATAPRDGTPFLVWADGYDWPEVIRWYEYDAEGREDTGEEGYFQYAEQAMADQFDWEHEATHWMPLPPAPDSALSLSDDGEAK